MIWLYFWGQRQRSRSQEAVAKASTPTLGVEVPSSSYLTYLHSDVLLVVAWFADDGRAEFDTSIVASMEVNGIVYQGVLFAQPPNIVGARIWQRDYVVDVRRLVCT